jgi:hypothetical protein
MKKAFAIAILFLLIVIGSMDRSEHTIYRDYDVSVAFNSLYVYRVPRRIDIILTIVGYHDVGHVTVNEIYARYGNGYKHKVNWKSLNIPYSKSLKIDNMWYPQEVRILLSGDSINWTRTSKLRIYLVIEHNNNKFIIVNLVEKW